MHPKYFLLLLSTVLMPWSLFFIWPASGCVYTYKECTPIPAEKVYSLVLVNVGVATAYYTIFLQIFGGIGIFMSYVYILEKSTASSNNVSPFSFAHVPLPSEPEPQLGMLILSNITPDSFNMSWTTRAGPFAKIVVSVSDSHSLYEPQQFTVSGDAQHAHVTGLVENTGYDVSVAGTTWAGDPTRPLTAFVMTGTHSKVLIYPFRILRWGTV